MTTTSRRTLVLGAAALSLLAACGNGVGSDGGQRIDARVDQTIAFMTAEYPGTATLMQDAAGMLVMPLVTEAGFGIGGAYGRGALRVGGISVDYYSQSQASVGLQIGAQQYATVLFFMTPESLQTFRTSDGWAAGADVTYAFTDKGETLSAATTNLLNPVIAVVFGQSGAIAGATIEGTKYTRIIP